MSLALKFLFFVVVGLLAAISTAVGQSGQNSGFNATSSTQIDDILSQIQTALVRAQTEAASNNLPALTSVSLELETEFAYGAGGELNLYILSVDGSAETKQLQTLKLTLAPPAAYTEEPIAKSEIAEMLSAAIVAAGRGVANARSRKPPLTLSKLEAEIRFAVKTSAAGGLKVEILSLGVGAKGDIVKNATQTMTVSFEAKPK